MSLIPLNEVLLDVVPTYEVVNQVNEAAYDGTVIDGTHYLALVRGPFFAVDKSSGNGRFYSRKLWERAIRLTENKRTNGLMIGTIGHNQPLKDEDLLKGVASHRVTRLWIDESTGMGYGEIVVLGSAAGRELNALLRGGVRLSVSSRAFGDFAGVGPDGNKAINPETYDLETFDFVQTPGVSSATPSLVNENKVIDKTPNNTNEDLGMSQTIVETLVADKQRVQTQYEGALKDNASLTEQNTQLSARTQLAEAASTKAVADLSEAQGKLQIATATNEAYAKIGTPEEVTESLTQSKAVLEQYVGLGSIESIQNDLEVLEQYEELGEFDKVSEAVAIAAVCEENGLDEDQLVAKLELLKQYEELGTIDEIGRVFEFTEKQHEEFKPLGSAAEITTAMSAMEESLKAYSGLGSPQDIASVFDIVESTQQAQSEAKLKEEAAQLSNTYGVDVDTVASMLESMGSAPTEEALKKLGTTNRFRLPENKTNTSGLNEEGKGQGNQSALDQPRLSRLMENFNK